MDPTTAPAGTPAAPTAPAAPVLAPVVGTTTGESFMPAGGAPAAASPPPAAPPAPAAAPAASGGSLGGKRITLASDDLKDRLSRAKAQALKDVFGTDNAEEIRARLAKTEALEKQAEEAKRAAMTEQQKLQHDLTKSRAERDRYRTELAMAQEREVVRDQSSFVERIAQKHVNPAALEEASLAFARKVSTTDPKIVAKWTERNIDEWFKKYVTEKPFMAKGPAAAPAAPQRRVERAPGGAARPAPRPAAPSSGATNGGKTFRPGQPNSMSKTEARDEMRRRGYSY